MSPLEHSAVLRALLRDKVHVLPNTVARLPTHQAHSLRSPMDLARLLLRPLASSPDALLRFWLDHPRGHAAIGPYRHGYQPGTQAVGRRQCDAVAWVSARQLLDQPGLADPLAHLLDHLLGSDGQAEGPWLSDGAGRTSLWSEVAHRLQRQASLGYALPEAGAEAHSYFAWGLRTYLLDRQSLNTADPGLERLLATTVFSDDFWRAAGISTS